MLPLSKSWFARWTWASQPWLFTEQEQTSASRTWWNSRVCSNHPSAGNCNVSHSRVLYCSHCLSLGATHTLLLRYACTDAFIYLFIYFCATTVANKSLPLFSARSCSRLSDWPGCLPCQASQASSLQTLGAFKDTKKQTQDTILKDNCERLNNRMKKEQCSGSVAYRLSPGLSGVRTSWALWSFLCWQ